MIFTIMLVSNQSGNIAPRLPTCARHVVTLLSRAQLLRIIISASRTRVRHHEGQIITNIAAPQITRSGHTGITARSLHQAGIDHVTTCIGRAALLPLQAGAHHAGLLRLIDWPRSFDISAGPEDSSSLHQPTPDTSASLADQLRHDWPDRGLRLGEPTFASIIFLWITTTNKPGAINPNIFCMFGFIFSKELLLWFVHHMFTGLSNGGRINDGRMLVRSVSVHRPATAASGARTDL